MKKLREFLFRLRALVRRRDLDREMREEMQHHLEMSARGQVADGMDSSEARYAALRQFGNVGLIEGRARQQRAFVWLEQGLQDLRYALRSLRQSPGFAAIVVLSLALAIGANTTLFTLVNDFLLRPLPVRQPDELVLLRYFDGAGGAIPSGTEGHSGRDPVTGRSWRTSFSLPAFERFLAHHPGLSDIFAFAPWSQVNVLVDGQPETTVSGQLVSGGYYAGLGVGAQLGRTLGPDDDRPAAEAVVVLSHRYWQKRFSGDPAVLGKTIQLNGVSATIVGVTPPGFGGAMQVGESFDFSVPMGLLVRLLPEGAEKIQPWYYWIRIMGRLAPDSTAARVRAALEPAFQQAAREAWELQPRRPGVAAEPMPGLPTLAVDSGAQGENDRRHEHAKTLQLLMGLVGLVLLAACANVANLLLARGIARRREIAVRLALGAGRGRIVRQLLTESLLLAVTGAMLGILVALWGRGLLLALRPVGNGVILELPLDLRVLGFTVATTGATALLFGLAPALRATRLAVGAEFQGGTRTLGGGARSRLSQGLMIVQIGLSVVLLVSTGLFVRTLRNLQAVDPGFNRHGLVLFRIEAASAGYQGPQVAALHAWLRERFAQLPGVTAATFSDIALISHRRIGRFLTVPGHPPPPGKRMGALTMVVADNFFAAMEMPLLLGRGFTSRDDAAAPQVAVVTVAFAREFFGTEQNALGRRFSWLGAADEVEIVGVTRDAKYTNLRDAANAIVYTPFLQRPAMDGTVNYAVRVVGDPAALFPAIPAAVREIDRTLPVRNLRTQDEQLDRLNAPQLLFARLSGFLGVLSLALAWVGLYGLMSCAVLCRTGEIGLRLALGALPGRVLAMILRESLGLVIIGVLVGVAAALAATRLVATMLYGLLPADPLTYVAVVVLLLAVALLACWLPARRAARVNPIEALRAG